GYLAQLAEAEDLEAARVGEDGAAPAHEAVQPGMLCDDLDPGAQPQMKGVAEHDLRAGGGELFGRHRLYRAVSPHRHEGRGIDAPMRKLERPAPRLAVPGSDAELHVSISIASPYEKKR